MMGETEDKKENIGSIEEAFIKSIIIPPHSKAAEFEKEAPFVQTCLISQKLQRRISLSPWMMSKEEEEEEQETINNNKEIQFSCTDFCPLIKQQLYEKQKEQSINSNHRPKFIKNIEIKQQINNTNRQTSAQNGSGLLASLIPSMMIKINPLFGTHQDILAWACVHGSVSFSEIIQLLSLNNQCVTRCGVMDNSLNQGWFNPQLLRKSNINGIDLLKIPGMNLRTLLNLNPTALELNMLQLDASTLNKMYGVGINELVLFRNVSAIEWIELLGLNKKVLNDIYKLSCNNVAAFIESGGGWKETHMKAMGYTVQDLHQLNLNVS